MNTQRNQASTEIGYLVNEQGEEVAITEAMIKNSLTHAEDICLGSPEQDEEQE